MIITISKPNEARERHVVVRLQRIYNENGKYEHEIDTASTVIAAVLGPGVRPVRFHDKEADEWRYVFVMSYLDLLLMAFPRATKSKGLQRRLDRLQSRELEERTVPPFNIPGLYNYKEGCEFVPFGFQYTAIAEAVEFLLGRMDSVEDEKRRFREHFLENDEMGLGKTVIALAALLLVRKRRFRNRQMNVLVVAPKNGKFVWERENDKFAQMDLQVVDADRQTFEKRTAAIKRRAEITVVNPEMLRGSMVSGFGFDKVWQAKHPDLFNFEYDIIIIDEYQRFGNLTSQQTKGLLQLKGKRFLPMSGTPYTNRPEQLWPTLHLCFPLLFPDYDLFTRSICIYQRGTGKVIGYKPQQMIELRDFMGERSIRRRKDQVLADLPKEHLVKVHIELNREQRKIYNKIRDEFILMLDSGETVNITMVMTQIMRLKQACFSPELFGGSKHSAKIDELSESLESLIQSGEKALIGSEWSKATRIMQREFAKWNPAYVDGSVTGDKRMVQADTFNLDDSCHIYIGTIGANRESVSLGAATHVILTDKDWSPFNNDQFVARSAVGGLRGLNATVDKITRLELIAADTYEERIEDMLADKEAWFNALFNKDGGKKVTRSILGSIRELI